MKKDRVSNGVVYIENEAERAIHGENLKEVINLNVNNKEPT